MDKDIAIKVQNVSKIYKLYDKPIDRLKESINPFGKKYHKDFYALKDVSFEVKKGETVGIIGKNGSGKSTLLQLITGVLTPTTGSIQVNGKVSALLELGAGFNPELTGIENVYLNGTIMGYSKEEMDKRLDDILSFADIGDYVKQPVKTYSSGMFVRLAFAVAVSVDPDILIVDEALAVGDMHFQLKCIDKMKSFKEDGKTILFVSHDIYSVRNFCDHVIWMMDGKIYLRGNVLSVTDQYMDYVKSELEQVDTPISGERKNGILNIDAVTILNDNDEEKNKFLFGENIKVVVDYTLSEKLPGVIGGVAIFDRRNSYICGLNTKLDEVKLPTSPGSYQLILQYKNMNLLPGSYFIDVGFFESSGIVPLDYKSRIASFQIFSTHYMAEGLTLLNHIWNYKKRT
ncbi:ABC transporter [Thermincola ferriacetica]|uniref:ABC transporter n=1 Tax=Thermincola ferriacetica TaxID=281456 RepID=A0A0L6W4K6_9FIRM|nr:ABC transporter ATP-binding protein [Thermincola ferriacetica]KNZ70029.1 ABC transporter [Thermincola ferriacetica]